MELMERQELANGMAVAIYDLSRKMAGDRWLVQIRCEASVPVVTERGRACNEHDLILQEEILARLGDTLTFQVSMKRNFVAEADKPAILAELVERVRQNILTHLANPLFPGRLFAVRYEELRANCLIERQYQEGGGDGPEEEGPADFSALFRE